MQEISLDGYQIVNPPVLFYRDPLECVQVLLRNPTFEGKWLFAAQRVYEDANQQNRIYGDWMSGDGAWSAQVSILLTSSFTPLSPFVQSTLPQGGTLLGVVLSSDKTNISAMTGDRIAHPLLLTLANLSMNIRMKLTYHALPLIALLPCPKFRNLKKSLHGVMENRLIHHCLDIVCKLLKEASSKGAFMSDSLGRIRCYFSPIIAYIADTPEAAVITGVGGRTSHLMLASHKTFGDHFRHPTRLGSLTLAQIQTISEDVDPWDLEAFSKEDQKRFRLNGVHAPFWRDWALPDGSIAEPSRFLTPEPLHHWHKQFWDHDAKWSIRAVGNQEIDLRFSLLQPCVGFRHFKAGISSLKQVTGRDHRDVQHYIVPIIANAVSKEFTLCIRSLTDFRYLAQSYLINDCTLTQISHVLDVFHQNKQAILDAGARVGKGNKSLNHFFIPKIELLHSVVSSICWSGAPIQWSTDPTERAHIDDIKIPLENTNNGQHGPQICRHLDRDERRRLFDLATAIREAGNNLEEIFYNPASRDEDGLDEELNVDWVAELGTIAKACGPSQKTIDLFVAASILPTHPMLDGMASVPLLALRTFSTPWAAFNLNRKPDIPQISIDSLAKMYGLPDLRPALLDLFSENFENPSIHRIGGHRRTHPNIQLPFTDIMVWFSFRIQTQSMDDGLVTHPRCLNVMPPSDD